MINLLVPVLQRLSPKIFVPQSVSTRPAFCPVGDRWLCFYGVEVIPHVSLSEQLSLPTPLLLLLS